MACTDNIIGYRACDRAAKFYLDDYGVSVNMAANIADDKFVNAKDMLDKLIQQSWDETIADITFDGMQANKILNDATYATIDKSGFFTGVKEVSWLLDDTCNLGSFYGSTLKIYIKTGGATVVSLIQGDNTSELYNDAPSDGDILELAINEFLEDDFSIEIDTEGEIWTGVANSECGCDGAYFTMDGDVDDYPFNFTYQVRCNKLKHLCKYVDLIAPVVINKVLGKVWFKAHTTDVFSNWVNSEGDKAIAMMVYYDSQYRAIVDSETSNKALGQYQIALKNLNIPKPSCRCCMECKASGWSVQSKKP